MVLALAALFFVAFVTWLLPKAMVTPPQSWPPVAVVVCVVLGAFSTAGVVVEMVRATVLTTSGWSDEKHFRVVMLAFGILFVVQLTGVLIALSSFR
jgi:hypothetical protein